MTGFLAPAIRHSTKEAMAINMRFDMVGMVLVIELALQYGGCGGNETRNRNFVQSYDF